MDTGTFDETDRNRLLNETKRDISWGAMTTDLFARAKNLASNKGVSNFSFVWGEFFDKEFFKELNKKGPKPNEAFTAYYDNPNRINKLLKKLEENGFKPEKQTNIASLEKLKNTRFIYKQ